MKKEIFKIGVISDTHGLLRKEAEKQLEMSNVIIHAGDIGDVEIINRLQRIAPVFSIRGNIDNENWADDFPEKLDFNIMNKRIFVVHDIKEVDINNEEIYDIIISGHSHKPLIKRENGVLYLNPGSAGKRRFDLPISIAQIQIVEDKISAGIIKLKI